MDYNMVVFVITYLCTTIDDRGLSTFHSKVGFVDFCPGGGYPSDPKNRNFQNFGKSRTFS